jgi:hypothetical protein
VSQIDCVTASDPLGTTQTQSKSPRLPTASESSDEVSEFNLDTARWDNLMSLVPDTEEDE